MRMLQLKLKKFIDQSYKIVLGKGVLKTLSNYLKVVEQFGCLIVITDHKVKQLYGKDLVRQLSQHGHKVLLLSVPAGDKSKSQHFKTYLEERMLKAKCDRGSMIIALGGGVVGDLAGFVAATYMRGIPYVQIPTTLLAMTDSSIGGKTGINTAQGKNLIGAIWQPKAVIVDVDMLKNLPKAEIINGLVEAVKMFIISDKHSLEFVIANLPKILNKHPNTLIKLIHRVVKIKADVVSKDETEKHQRMILNFGHTIGHALEKISAYKIPHGIAVGMGMLVEGKISVDLGLLPIADYNRIESILKLLKIDLKILKKWQAQAIIQQTLVDKKGKNGKARYVLLKTIGQIYVKNQQYAHNVDEKIVKKSLASLTFNL